MEPLKNRHGEWNVLFAFASSMPIFGTWITFRIGGNKHDRR